MLRPIPQLRSHPAALSIDGSAAGIANTLKNLGTSLSLRFKDPNGLILEFMAKVKRSLVYERTSRSSAHSYLQRWLLHRQNWWRRRSSHENSKDSRGAAA